MAETYSVPKAEPASSLQPSTSTQAALGGADGKDRAGSEETDPDGTRKRSSRIGKMEHKKREEEERKAQEEADAARKAEEKRLARLRKKQERAQHEGHEESRCASSQLHGNLNDAAPSVPPCGALYTTHGHGKRVEHGCSVQHAVRSHGPVCSQCLLPHSGPRACT